MKSTKILWCLLLHSGLLCDGALRWGRPRTVWYEDLGDELNHGTLGLSGGDLNDDGFLDLVWVTQSPPRIYAAYGDGEGGFNATVVADHVKDDRIFDVVVGDVDGDGSQDLVVSGGEALHLYVSRPRGFASIRARTERLWGNWTLPMRARAERLGGNWTLSMRARAERLGGNWTLKRYATQRLAKVQGTHAVDLADVDGNGVVDVVAASQHTGGLWLNQDKKWRSRSICRADKFGCKGLHKLVLADVDKDGSLDAVACSDVSALRVLYGDGGHSWVKASKLQDQNIGNRDACVADFDGDGLNDLVATSKYDPYRALVIHYGEDLGTGRPRLGLGANLLAGHYGTQSLDCRDFDGDGDVDVLVTIDSHHHGVPEALNVTKRVDILSVENLGQRRFGAARPLRIPDVCGTNAYLRDHPEVRSKAGPESLFSGDFDGDGARDVAFSCRRGGLVAWIPRIPSGASTAARGPSRPR